jgi:hypothetical protein
MKLKFTVVVIFILITCFACKNKPIEDAQAENKSAPNGMPYPQSDLIIGMSIDSNRISIGHGDNWAITWADDDRQYSFFTDGKGFGAHAKDVSISPVAIEGVPPDIIGWDINSETGTIGFNEGGENSAKVCGIIMIDRILYAWLRNINLPGKPKGTGSRLIYSRDYGKSWNWLNWNWPDIGYPSWLNAGKNYSAAQDEYVYFISPDGPSAYFDYENLLMARVEKEKILYKEAYLFYGGMNEKNESLWVEYNDRLPIFTNVDGCFRPDIVYNPGLKRYFLSTASPYGEWQWWADENPNRMPHLGIFEGANPWGPWKTVLYKKNWGKPENRFSPHIPSKWISEDGASFYLLYSCIPNGPYRFNIQKCSLEIKE